MEAGFREPARDRIGARAYFDSTDLSGNRIALTIAQASSSARAMIPGVRTQLRALLAKKGPLGSVIPPLNDHVLREVEPNDFLTLVVAVHDPDGMTLETLVAGHESPFLYRPGQDTFIDIQGNGPGLGLIEDLPALEGASTAVESGDVFVGYTDGVSERRNEALELYGLDRIKDATRTAVRAGADAKAIVDAIRQDCDGHASGRPPDADIALLVAKF